MKVPLVALALMAIASAPVAAQGDPPPKKEVVYVEPSDDDYAGMIVAATAWARANVSKSLGVLQRDEAPASWRRGVEAAAKRYDLQTIELNDFVVLCNTRQASRSAPASRVCNVKGAEAVLQFNMVRVVGDAGLVLTSVTRVPKGASKTETTHHCLSLVRKGPDWEAQSAQMVPDPDRCT